MNEMKEFIVSKKNLLLSIGLLVIIILAMIVILRNDKPESATIDVDRDQTVVTFLSWSPVSVTTGKMIEAFEKNNPNIKIEATILNYEEFLMTLQTKAASGDMPDLIGLEPGALTQQYRKYLSPLQNRISSAWGDDWQSRFNQIGLDQARLGNPVGDDSFYGLPVLVQTINAWYTVPLLEEAGFEVPETYDDMLELVDYFKGTGVAPMMIGAGDGWLRRDVFMQIVHNIDSGIIYEAEKGNVKFTHESIVEAMTWWKKFFDDGIFQTGALGLTAYPGSQEFIEAGRAATFPMGAWWMQMAGNDSPPPLSKGLVGFAPMKFPDVTGRGAPDDLLGGIDLMIGVSKNASDEAYTVLFDFIAGDAAQVLINTFNDIPAVKGLEPESFETANQEKVWNTLVNEWMPKVKYPRQLVDPHVKQALEDALGAVATGEKTPMEGAQMVQEAWTPLN